MSDDLLHVGPEEMIITRLDPLRVVSPEVCAAEIEEAPHPEPQAVETMGITFHGFDFRLTFRRYERRASLSCEVLTDAAYGEWQEMAGYDIPEGTMKFHRGIEWLHEYAYDHGARPD